MSERNKVLIAVALFAVLIVVLVIQFVFVLPKRRGGPPAPPITPTKPATSAQAPAQEAAQPTAREAKPRVEKPKTEPAESIKEERQKPPESARPKLAFLSEEVENRYLSSRFFVENEITMEKDPFLPAGYIASSPQAQVPQVFEGIFGVEGGRAQPAEGVPSGAEVPALGLPKEAVTPALRVVLLGLSKGSQSTAALFSIMDEKGTELERFLARPGWVVGQDYVFLGVSGSNAELLDSRSNSVIQVSIGGAL